MTDRTEAKVLRRLWFPVARSEDVASDPVHAELLGERLAVFRSHSLASVTVVTDRCPHRGARLSLGRVVGGALECPYHGWRWARDGQCTLVPSQPGAHPNARLAAWPAQERYGLVWACLGEPLLGHPAIPEIDRGPDWDVACGETFDVCCGLRSITENFRDSSHFAFVHRATFGDVSPEIPIYTVRRIGWELEWDVTVRFGPPWEADQTEHDSAMKYRFGETQGDGQGPSRFGTRTQLLHYRFVMPSFAYVRTEHHGAERLVCQAAAPLDEDGTRSRVFWFVAADSVFLEREGALARQVDIEGRIFAEDVPIVESLDPVESPLELEGQAHVRADRYCIAYRRMFAEFLEKFSTAHEAAPSSSVAADGPAVDLFVVPPRC